MDAATPLRPFTLVLGANGSGKSNFLKFFQMASQGGDLSAHWTRHISNPKEKPYAEFRFSDGRQAQIGMPPGQLTYNSDVPWAGKTLSIFNPSPDRIAATEKPTLRPEVKGDGSGTCQVLDALKTGDREDLFIKIEEMFRTYVPEVEKLSLATLDGGKQIQVREKGLRRPLAASELSEGTRLILCLLTILHQDKPPPLVLLEDIDRGLHPRLFEYVAPLIGRIAGDHDINIIATTHNPYLVDYFREDKAAVVLVEKENGESRLIPLPDRLKETTYSDADAEDMPLGQLWFSGLIGGTPRAINSQRKPA